MSLAGNGTGMELEIYQRMFGGGDLYSNLGAENGLARGRGENG